ncbi:MAG: MiaB/RimO family radical SAM methylthiotransferase [Prevotellaceae bacterium]|nr:MiaB/RimO family radical SAM methylthiotransferase [Prevotellaceae bacterium]
MLDLSKVKGKKVAYYTLGCKLNFSETSTFAQQMKELGALKAQSGERADICYVNTCSVTDMADHKCRQAINRLVRNNPGAYVMVTGCYAQLKPEEVAAIPGVSEVVVKDLKSFTPSCSRGDRTRYFLKVQDGCNCFCTYCTIPFARGRSRNGSIESLVGEARRAAADGGKEIVITGVNIGDFGRTTGEKFIDLVRALDEVEGIERYRISSLEPDLISDELIDFVAGSRRFMPHFHIPLQCGSDTVLKLMHRHYDSQLFADKIHRIKERMPNAFIGVDVMVGSRGETPECFDESYKFIEQLDVTQLHVFPYSERPGTKALNIAYVVDEKEKKRRSKLLLDLSKQKTHDFYAAHIGREALVLMEHSSKGKPMNGFTENYVRVEMPSDASLDNKIVKVRLGDFNADGSALKVVEL